MSAVERIGDPNTAGAPVVGTPITNVYANGILVAGVGSPIASHGLFKHGAAIIASGSDTVFANGIPVTRVGDPDDCGHSQASGSPDVFAG